MITVCLFSWWPASSLLFCGGYLFTGSHPSCTLRQPIPRTWTPSITRTRTPRGTWGHHGKTLYGEQTCSQISLHTCHQWLQRQRWSPRRHHESLPHFQSFVQTLTPLFFYSGFSWEIWTCCCGAEVVAVQKWLHDNSLFISLGDLLLVFWSSFRR
jgi:hypothetical protein